MKMSLIRSFVLLPFVGLATASAQGFDHCRSCHFDLHADVKMAASCPNLTRFEDEIHVASFLKSFENTLFKKSAKSNFKNLPSTSQTEEFHSAFAKMTSGFGKDLTEISSREAAQVQQRLLNSVGWVAPSSVDDLARMMDSEERIKQAMKPLICEFVHKRKENCEGHLAELSGESEKSGVIQQSRKELLRFLSEGVSVEEMISAQVLPTSQSSSRLYFALAEKFDLGVTPMLSFNADELKASCRIAGPINPTILAAPRMPSSVAVSESVALCFLNQNQLREFACGPQRGTHEK